MITFEKGVSPEKQTNNNQDKSCHGRVKVREVDGVGGERMMILFTLFCLFVKMLIVLCLSKVGSYNT